MFLELCEDAGTHPAGKGGVGLVVGGQCCQTGEGGGTPVLVRMPGKFFGFGNGSGDDATVPRKLFGLFFKKMVFQV